MFPRNVTPEEVVRGLHELFQRAGREEAALGGTSPEKHQERAQPPAQDNAERQNKLPE